MEIPPAAHDGSGGILVLAPLGRPSLMSRRNGPPANQRMSQSDCGLEAAIGLSGETTRELPFSTRAPWPAKRAWQEGTDSMWSAFESGPGACGMAPVAEQARLPSLASPHAAPQAVVRYSCIVHARWRERRGASADARSPRLMQPCSSAWMRLLHRRQY